MRTLSADPTAQLLSRKRVVASGEGGKLRGTPLLLRRIILQFTNARNKEVADDIAKNMLTVIEQAWIIFLFID